ncbi:MAG: hypothetical protein U0790_14060 [Isosphaeraceae bacterium]
MNSRAMGLAAVCLLMLGNSQANRLAQAAGTVSVTRNDRQVTLEWPLGQGDERGRVEINLRDDAPLFQAMAIRTSDAEPFRGVLTGVDPAAFVVVGTRRGTVGRPPGMSEFNEFFDTPANRPHQAYRSRLESRHADVLQGKGRATVRIGDLSAGPFRGRWEISVYAGSRLVHLEAVLKTDEPHRAFFYDLALASDEAPASRFTWVDVEGHFQRAEPGKPDEDRPLAVRHRMIAASSGNGSVACFPPPHQYFFPRDLTDNQKTVWFGRNHRGLDSRFGFGIRQTERGGGGFVPWFNAPPGTEQRLGAFLVISHGDGLEAIREALRYTNYDRFPELPGYRTLSSHFHMAIAVAALERKAKRLPDPTPDFVRMFKDMGVEMVHLAEFHGDGHPQDPGPLRIEELKSMFDECRRLSDDQLLLIPGEEANVHFGVSRPGQHPGHWLYLFPRPVYWTMKQAPDQPFREERPGIGTVYHVGNALEMHQLLDQEGGLAWTAHARIKASSWAPDAYRDAPYFVSDRWLGAAWKAMPADLSDDRLGRRVLDLMDDMANWGQRKFVLGEVDVFKLDHTHELYGHMNVNYVRLDRVPRYGEGWSPVLDALRAGRFFVSTGEVLIPRFMVTAHKGEVPSGPPGESAVLSAHLRWTFPLRFAEIVSGDGNKTYRERIDLSDTSPFGERVLNTRAELKGRKWVRLEVWDVAGNGAFTQPVWLR